MLEERKLFVAGLPQQTREGDLRGHFARYGEVVHTRVVLDMASGNSRGFGFVEFADEAATLRALADDEMPNHVFRGRKILLNRFHNLNGRDVEVKIAVPKSPTYSEAKYYHMRMDMSLSPITYYDGMVHVHPYTPYTFGCVTPLAHLTHSGYGYGGPIDYSCYAYGGPIGHQHDLIIAKLLPSTSIPQIPQRNDLLTVRLVPTPTRNGVVSAKPAAERGGGCEAVSVQQERGGAEECEVARPRDVLEAPVPYFLCHQHNPLRRRLGDRAEASQDDDASCSFLPWLRLGRYETVTDEDVGSGGGDPAGGRPLRPLAEEATTQRADSGGSESIQGKRDRGRRHGPH
uniref:RRM domain-containing protein n=1 Tax=Oryza rufipogon TaxID=4529 RepID=A0A0E0P1U6_ORYRU